MEHKLVLHLWNMGCDLPTIRCGIDALLDRYGLGIFFSWWRKDNTKVAIKVAIYSGFNLEVNFGSLPHKRGYSPSYQL